MTQIVKRYWPWNEQFNDTPYKLGSEIQGWLQKGIVCPDKSQRNVFMSCVQGGSQYIRVYSGKVVFVAFSSVENCIFPTIKEGLWEMEEPKFTKTLNRILGPPCEPTHGDYLFVVFRGDFVTMAVILRRLPTDEV